MSGLEIMLWVWTGALVCLATNVLSLAHKTSESRWGFLLAVIAGIELAGAAWLGSWAFTIHALRVALQ